jgi:hypothetical protein
MACVTTAPPEVVAAVRKRFPDLDGDVQDLIIAAS